MKPEIKKLLILNLPYLLFVWLFDKVGAAVRLSPGADASAKLLHLGDGFTAAFSSIAPSFHPADLALGIAGAVKKQKYPCNRRFRQRQDPVLCETVAHAMYVKGFSNVVYRH